MTPRPVARFVLRLVCPQCGRGYYGALPVAFPQALPGVRWGTAAPRWHKDSSHV